MSVRFYNSLPLEIVFHWLLPYGSTNGVFCPPMLRLLSMLVYCRLPTTKQQRQLNEYSDQHKSFWFTEPPTDSSNEPNVNTESPTQEEETKGNQHLPWLVTAVSGERYWFKPNRKKENKSPQKATSFGTSPLVDERNRPEVVVEFAGPDEPILEDSMGETWPSTPLTVFRSYDPATGQTLFTRPEDGLIIVEPNPQHISSGFIVHHADGTRQTHQVWTPVGLTKHLPKRYRLLLKFEQFNLRFSVDKFLGVLVQRPTQLRSST